MKHKTLNKITLCCDLVNVLGAHEYEKECEKYGVSRLFDAPDAEVLKLWTDSCKLTEKRAKLIIDAVSTFNRKNLNRQIYAKLSVNYGDVTLTINKVKYDSCGYVSAITALRHLGLRLTFKEMH